MAAVVTSICIAAGSYAPPASSAQAWNDTRTQVLVERATERRAQQLADTTLRDYTSQAHGYLTFLAQIGEGFTEPPRIVKADELALEILWRAPNLSRQRIIGRRDTLLLPTDINYHRDHLGIVQNNFPAIIRLGDGDEVGDVPHPLSEAGLGTYDFAIRDSLSIRLPDRTIDVYEVRVRPRNDREPRIIGAVYIDKGSGEVVRMAFSFTRSALLDQQLDDVFIVLENALVSGRFWLPRRQEVEIRRSGSWLDYPVRGIIRGRWEICCYTTNTGLDPRLFAGQEIVQQSPSVLRRYKWKGGILDSLPPDVRTITDEDVARVQAEARELVRAQALQSRTGTSLSAGRISDFVRVNRVEGFALGAGIVQRFGSGLSFAARGRYGIDDAEAKARVQLSARRASGSAVHFFVERDYRDAGDVMETSLVRNSIAAQEFGSDYTDPFDIRVAGLAVEFRPRLGVHSRLEGTLEYHGWLRVNAVPHSGRYEPTIHAWPIRASRISLMLDRPTALAVLGTEMRFTGEASAALFDGRDTVISADRPYFGRVFMSARVERPVGLNRIVLQSMFGAVTGVPGIPPQELIYFGGPTTGPGYPYHSFTGSTGASQRLEWRVPVGFPAVSLGRYGKTAGAATLAPFVQTVYVGGSAPRRGPGRSGWYPSAGAGVLLFFDLVRLDVARGLRKGRWSFSIDIERQFWGIL